MGCHVCFLFLSILKQFPLSFNICFYIFKKYYSINYSYISVHVFTLNYILRDQLLL